MKTSEAIIKLKKQNNNNKILVKKFVPEIILLIIQYVNNITLLFCLRVHKKIYVKKEKNNCHGG